MSYTRNARQSPWVTVGNTPKRLTDNDLEQVELGSRNERPMTRYFPELVAAATAELPERCVIDGEIIIATDHGLDFEALQQRIHPANSRVPTLAEQTPASFMAFCVRAVNDRICLERGKGPRCGFSPWVTA
jgi:ATP-dependent DNA ligase